MAEICDPLTMKALNSAIAALADAPPGERFVVSGRGLRELPAVCKWSVPEGMAVIGDVCVDGDAWCMGSVYVVKLRPGERPEDVSRELSYSCGDLA